MKKKAVERIARERQQRIAGLEALLGRRKEELRELGEQVEGYKQVIQILSAYIAEGVEKKGEVIIPIDALADGIKVGYQIECTDKEYILRKKSS